LSQNIEKVNVCHWDSNAYWDFNVPAHIYHLTLAETYEDILKGKLKFERENGTIQVKRTPFAEGAFSFAHYCKLTKANSRTHKLVLKAFKKE